MKVKSINWNDKVGKQYLGRNGFHPYAVSEVTKKKRVVGFIFYVFLTVFILHLAMYTNIYKK